MGNARFDFREETPRKRIDWGRMYGLLKVVPHDLGRSDRVEAAGAMRKAGGEGDGQFIRLSVIAHVQAARSPGTVCVEPLAAKFGKSCAMQAREATIDLAK